MKREAGLAWPGESVMLENSEWDGHHIILRSVGARPVLGVRQFIRRLGNW